MRARIRLKRTLALDTPSRYWLNYLFCRYNF
ncbi:YsgD/CorL family protein [Dryocola clanedunensis]